MNIIEVKNLERSFKIKNNENFLALKGLSFEVRKGEIFGLLGPNGAGKTTTIKILSTMLAPSSGEAKILGFDTFNDSKEVRKYINFIFGGERSLYWRLTAKENLEYFADLYKIPKKEQKILVPQLLKKVGLMDEINKRVEIFSKGMKQRLQIARALLNKPEVIFLDEPSIGLDPIGAMELKKIIKELSRSGTTIILTTHYLNEAEELCDRIAIINKGKIIALDTITGLQNLLSSDKKAVIKEKKLEEKKNFQNLEVTLEDIYLELLGGE